MRLFILQIKGGVLDDPQIRMLIKDEHFMETMLELQKNMWLSFQDLNSYLLGNTRVEN